MIRVVQLLVMVLMFVGGVSARDLSLDECKAMALATDEDVRIAQNRVVEAGIDRGVARTAYLPKFDVNGGVLYRAPDSEFGDIMTFQMKGTYMAGLSLTQPVYVGGKIIAANQLSKVGEKVSAEQLAMTKMDVVAEAEKSYWMYVAVLEKIGMIEAYMLQIDSLYSYTSSAYELGLTTALSLSRLESRRSEIAYRHRQAVSGADICRMALCRIIGVPDTTSITPTERLDDNLLQLPDYKGIGDRPELRLSELNVEAKQIDVKMVRSDYLPTIGLQLGYSAFGNMKMKSMVELPDGSFFPYTQSFGSTGFMGALSVSIPLFHWGEGYKKIKKSKIEVENARLALDKNRKMMELQARQAYNNYVDGKDLIESAEKAFSEAEENLRLMREQYEVGLMTMTDLLEAQSQWHTSYSNLIEAKAQFRINRVEYLRSTGSLEF